MRIHASVGSEEHVPEITLFRLIRFIIGFIPAFLLLFIAAGLGFVANFLLADIFHIKIEAKPKI